MPIEEQEQIADAYLKEHMPQKEVAQRHRVTVQLVRDLVAEAKAQPEKRLLAKAKQEQADQLREVIHSTAS